MPIYSIIPELIQEKGIKLFNENLYEVTICEVTQATSLLPPFEQPFFVIDTFARKTTKEIKVVSIEVEELKKLKYGITSMRAIKRWFNGQRVIYRLESLSNKIPGSRRLSYIPDYHKVQKDILNKRIRLVGPNSGYPHYESKFSGGAGPWINL